MRSFFFLTTVFGLLPFCLVRPYVGVLVWSWISYMNPHRLTWGSTYNFPVAELVAIPTLIGSGFVLFKERRLLPLRLERETILLFLLWGMFTLSTLFARNPGLAWPEWQKISKILLMTFLTIRFATDRVKLKYLLLVIALSLGFYAFKGALFSLRTGGEWRVYGPEASFLADANSIGLALNMSLPIFLYLAKAETNRHLKSLLYLLVPACVVAILFTYSRGALVGLLVVVTAIVLKISLRYRILALGLAVAVLPLITVSIPEKWFERMDTILEYEDDPSALSRMQSWTLAWRVALDNPLTGIGLNGLNDPSLFDIYYPDAPHWRSGVHSVYFEALGEGGFITLGLFAALLVSCLLSLRRSRRDVRSSPSFAWLTNYSHMVEVSLAAYMVSGAFLELMTFDLFYHLVAIVAILKGLARVSLTPKDPAPSVPLRSTLSEKSTYGPHLEPIAKRPETTDGG